MNVDDRVCSDVNGSDKLTAAVNLLSTATNSNTHDNSLTMSDKSIITTDHTASPVNMQTDELQCTRLMADKNQQSVTDKGDDKPPSSKKPKLANDLPLPESPLCLVVEDIKENIMDDDVPMDLSKGMKKTVVASVDNSDSLRRKRTLETLAIQRLREELRNEETALLLLRKLRLSQLSNSANANSRVHLPAVSTATGQQMSARPQTAVRAAGMPLVNGSSNNHVGYRTEQPRQSFASRPPTSVAVQNGSARGVAPHVTAPRQSVGSSQPTSRHQPVIPSPSVIAHRPIVPHHHQHQPSPSPREAVVVRPPPAPEPTLAQRQAAAKLAVRRQLEATLLQLPLPKCPPPELNFIPSTGSYGEFIALLGLEEAVQCIANSRTKLDDNSDVDVDDNNPKIIEDVASAGTTENGKPFECAKCQTDFTTIWKHDKEMSSAVVCERCATLTRKQALKQEHTDRLKAAFLQALQQERELEATGYMSTVPSAVVVGAGASRTRPELTQQRNYDWRLHHSASDSRLMSVAQQRAGSGVSSVLVSRPRVEVPRSQLTSAVTQQFIRHN
jgi:hypothetical protein